MATPSPTCLLCGYALAGLDAASPCPECGASAAAARTVPPLTLHTWARTLVRMTVSPHRVFANLPRYRDSTATALMVNLVIGWIIITLAIVLPSLVENLNDDRRDSAGPSAVLVPLLILTPFALLTALPMMSMGVVSSLLALALTAPTTALVAGITGRKTDWGRIAIVVACASYAAVSTSLAALLTSLAFCTLAIAAFDGVGSPVSWFTGGSIVYLGLPAAIAAVALPCILTLWGVLATSPPEKMAQR